MTDWQSNLGLANKLYQNLIAVGIELLALVIIDVIL